MSSERAEVVIVGGGPAGLSAAAELRMRGAGRVVVVERELDPGGVPRHSHHTGFGLRDLHRSLSGPEYARRLADAATRAGAELMTGTQATEWRGPLELELTGPGGRTTLAADAVVLATGSWERPRSARLIPGTRPEGVITTGILQQLVYLQGARLAGRAVVVGAEHVSYSALATLHRAGARTVAMLTEHPRHQTFAAFALGGAVGYRAPLRTRTVLSEIHGSPRVEAVTVTDLQTGERSLIECELVVLTADWIPDHALAISAGARLDRATRGPLIDGAGRTTVPGLFAAGNITQGAEPADVAAITGRNVANAVVAQVHGSSWPRSPVRIVCAPPLRWIVPGAIGFAGESSGPLRLRALEALRDVLIEVRQAERVLHRQRLAQLMPGRSALLASTWIASADPGISPILVRAVSARRLR